MAVSVAMCIVQRHRHPLTRWDFENSIDKVSKWKPSIRILCLPDSLIDRNILIIHDSWLLHPLPVWKTIMGFLNLDLNRRKYFLFIKRPSTRMIGYYVTLAYVCAIIGRHWTVDQEKDFQCPYTRSGWCRKNSNIITFWLYLTISLYADIFGKTKGKGGGRGIGIGPHHRHEQYLF